MDLSNIIVALIVASPGILAVLQNRKIDRKVDAYHEDVNGKVQQLIDSRREGNLAEGRAAGVEQERDRKSLSKKVTLKGSR